MLPRRAFVVPLKTCRGYSTASGSQLVPVLSDSTLETFREQAFKRSVPALLPRKSFRQLPATHKWFEKRANRNYVHRSYLSRFNSTIVPLEISNNDQFSRIEQPLSFFLECVYASFSTFEARPNGYLSTYIPNAHTKKRTAKSNDFFSASTSTTPRARVYLAQAAIADLPQALRDDLPTPEIVLKAGKGDIYDSSIWLGEAPTYTALHRDPNPNLFVQLAGKKVVRLFRPDVGDAIFAKVQEKIGGSASATMRGEEMMKGIEKHALEQEVWNINHEGEFKSAVWEADLGTGDGLFIPKGWWHSIKGVGEGMTGSVNWWFR